MSARQTFPRLDGYAQAQYVVKNAAADEASQALDLLDSQAAEITRLTDGWAWNELRAEVARLTEALRRADAMVKTMYTHPDSDEQDELWSEYCTDVEIDALLAGAASPIQESPEP